MPQDLSSEDLSSEKTTVLATYPTRHDAEMAIDRLEDHDIKAFITADDAGQMHPELQMAHGVKLVVLERAQKDAREVLEDTDMFYREGPEEEENTSDQAETNDRAKTTFSPKGRIFKVGILLVIGLLILWTLFVGLL